MNLSVSYPRCMQHLLICIQRQFTVYHLIGQSSLVCTYLFWIALCEFEHISFGLPYVSLYISLLDCLM